MYRPLDVESVIPYVRDHPQARARVDTEGELEATPGAIGVLNPAFDVTPARCVTAIVIARGVVGAPCEENLRTVVLGLEPSARASRIRWRWLP